MEISTLISILSILMAVIAFIFNVITNYKSSVRTRRQATLDAYNMLQNQALDQLNAFSASDVKIIAESGGGEEYKEISKCMARIEHFCVGVEEEIYDFDTLYKLAHGYLDDTIYQKLLPMLEDKCANQREDFYANFANVVKRMKQQ